MESKLRKPSYKYMHVILNQCVRGRMPQAMFAVFLHSMIKIALYAIAVSMSASPKGLILNLLMLLLACFTGELFTFGLYNVLAPLVRNRATSIKNMFAGFRGGNKRAAKAAIAFTGMNSMAVIAVSIIASIIKKNIPQVLEGIGKGGAALAAAGLLVVLLVILTLPFSFTYLVLLTKQETGVLESFTVSWRLLSGQIFHFVGFVIYSCGRDLAMVIVIQLMLLIMPKGGGVSMYLQLLSTIASFMGVLAEYRVMTRGHMAICIYFFSEAGILHPHGGQETMTTGPEAMPDCIDAGSCSGNSDSGGSQGDVGE